MFQDKKALDLALSALGDHLQALGSKPVDLLVCGGSALQALGLVERPTRDIDAVASIEHQGGLLVLRSAEPFPAMLQQAIKKVAKDLNLLENWLNSGPTSALDFGLPEGILGRVVVQEYGSLLTIRFISRHDQIYFKLYAAADQKAFSRHFSDLAALKPSAQELESAARWTMTHDPSAGFKQVLKGALAALGFKDVAERI